MSTPRAVARSLAAGQPGGTLAVPLALHVSARIAERDAEDFVYDPTQLANALRDLIEAVGPDGVPVTDPAVLLAGCTTAESILASEQLKVALEATRRLRASYGDAIALAAVLPGPATIAGQALPAGAAWASAVAAGVVVDLGREFLAAGADLLIVADHEELPGTSLATLANVARFHQALALSHTVARYGLPAAAPQDLSSPAQVRGVAVTPESLTRLTDLAVLRDWVAAVRGCMAK
ncbi:MAG: hypothetical protein ABR926_24795 [Streptosporangiaceae bacterium]